MHWLAQLSTGEVVKEEWIDGDISPWQRLMEKCKVANVYITDMILVDKHKPVVALPRNAIGYWHANAMHAIQGLESFTYPGIGWVADGMLHIVWYANGNLFSETRVAKEGQIIWANGR